MAQLSIYDKQRHHSKKDFTCSIGARDYIYITFRHDTWKRFTNGEYIKVIRTEGGAFKFGDPYVGGPGSVFKLKTDKKGDPQTREHTRYLQIDGKKYPGFLEIARRTAGSYDFPKQEEPKKNEAVEFLKKLAETDDNITLPTEPAPATYPPLNLGELFQLAINNAVALAFAKYKDDMKAAQDTAERGAFRAGYETGFLKGKTEAAEEVSKATIKLGSWFKCSTESARAMGAKEIENYVRRNIAATMLDQIAKNLYIEAVEIPEEKVIRYTGTLKIFGTAEQPDKWAI